MRSIYIFGFNNQLYRLNGRLPKVKWGWEVNDDCMSCEPQYVDKLWFIAQYSDRSKNRSSQKLGSTQVITGDKHKWGDIMKNGHKIDVVSQ